ILEKYLTFFSIYCRCRCGRRRNDVFALPLNSEFGVVNQLKASKGFLLNMMDMEDRLKTFTRITIVSVLHHIIVDRKPFYFKVKGTPK
nr:reverse transcriptase domain-containing protein [Tanacetum cinerariifolium]